MRAGGVKEKYVERYHVRVPNIVSVLSRGQQVDHVDAQRSQVGQHGDAGTPWQGLPVASSEGRGVHFVQNHVVLVGRHKPMVRPHEAVKVAHQGHPYLGGPTT
jgi:hypothetical protein